MTDAEMTPGEIQRWLERIDRNVDALREEVRAVGGPLATLTLRVGTNESAIEKLQRDVQGLLVKAAALSAVIAFAGFVIGLFWRH